MFNAILIRKKGAINMALFTIHYEKTIPTSITYRLDNIEETKRIEELLCDFLNAFETSHMYFRPEFFPL